MNRNTECRENCGNTNINMISHYPARACVKLIKQRRVITFDIPPNIGFWRSISLHRCYLYSGFYLSSKRYLLISSLPRLVLEFWG